MLRESWEIDLVQCANELIGKPFEWGNTDCAILCAKCFDAMTGEDTAALCIDQYHTEKEAVLFHKGLSVESYLNEYGAEEIKPGFQNAGDFILFDTDTFLVTAGVCLGMKCLVVDKHRGVEAIRFSMLPEIKKILRVANGRRC